MGRYHLACWPVGQTFAAEGQFRLPVVAHFAAERAVRASVGFGLEDLHVQRQPPGLCLAGAFLPPADRVLLRLGPQQPILLLLQPQSGESKYLECSFSEGLVVSLVAARIIRHHLLILDT